MDVKPPFDPNQPFEAVAAAKPPFDPSKPFEAAPQAAAPVAEPDAPVGAMRSVTQGATGFNEGFSHSVLGAIDAASNLLNKPAEWITGQPVPAPNLLEGTFNKTFVDPMGAPQNRVEQTLRAGGKMAGENLPLMATGAGVAGAPLRSGVTMAEQAAPGVANKIRGAADAVLDNMAAHPGASAVAENVGAAVSGAGGNIGRNVAKDAGGSEHQQQGAEMFGQLALPSTAALWSKFGLGALAYKGTKYVGGKVLDNVPESALPEQLRPAGGTYETRKADQLAFSNNEGKYAPNAAGAEIAPATPRGAPGYGEPPPPVAASEFTNKPDTQPLAVPAPNPPNFAARRMDAGQAKREATAAEAASKEFKQIVDQPDAAANMAEADRLSAAIPGFKPGVAKATQDPALLKLQENLESRSTGDELRGVQQAHDSNVEAIRGYKDQIVPPAEAPVPTVTGYHGSRDVIQKFDPEKTRLDRGVFFAEDPKLANKFADGTALDGDTARIYGEDSPAEIKRWVAEHAGTSESERIGAIIDQAERLPWGSEQKDRLAKTVTDELGKITALDQEHGPSSPNVTRATLELGKNHKADLGGRFEWDKERAAIDQARAKGADSVTFTNAGTPGDFHTMLNGDKIHPHGTEVRRKIENPQDVVAAANAGRVQGVNKKIDTQIEGVNKQISDVSASLPETDPSAVGTYLRDTRKSLKGEADARVSELRKNVDPEGTGVVQVEGQQPMSVNTALDRRAQINQDLADHYGATNRDAAATKTIRELQAEKEALDGAINKVNAPGLKEYNDYYRDEYAPRFLQGASRDVGRFARNGYEGNRVASEDVPGKFFAPNNISEARQFNKLYGEDAGARQQMTDHALDDLRRTVVDPNTGQMKEGGVNKWLAKNERLLNEMPWVRDAVKAKNPDELYSRLGQLEQRQRAVADTKVAKLFNGAKNPEQHIDAALNDWQVMKGLRNSVRGDPQGEAALRRAVIDRAPDPMNVEKFDAWLKGNDRALRQVMEPTHLKALQDVLAAAKINNTLPRPKGTVDLPGSLADKGAKVFGITVPSLLQRMLSVKQGRMSAEYGVADVGVRALRQFSNREIEGAWKEALYNPKVAKDLQLIVKNGGATPIQKNRLYAMTVGLHDTEENTDLSKPWKPY